LNTKFIPAAKFQLLTPLFDALCSLVGLGKRYREKIAETLHLRQENMKVLDAGCGSGSLALDVKKQYPKCIIFAVDADPRILVIAQRKATREKVEINFKEAFLQKLPFIDNSFDVVYSSLVFHHLNKNSKNEAMKEIYRVLKKNGRFLLVDFGKPKNKLVSLFSWFTVLLEEGMDNYQGKIPGMLSSAGFSEVKEVGRYRGTIVFLEAIK